MLHEKPHLPISTHETSVKGRRDFSLKLLAPLVSGDHLARSLRLYMFLLEAKVVHVYSVAVSIVFNGVSFLANA